MSSGNNSGAPRGQPGRGQLRAARTAANQVPYNPVPPQGQGNPNALTNKIAELLTRLTNARDPIVTFIRTTEPDFIRGLETRIQAIRASLDQLTIEDNALANRIVTLRDSSNNARQDIDRLNQTLQQSQEQYRIANEEVARLQGANQQATQANQALQQEKAAIEAQHATQAQIIDDATNALTNLEGIINEIQGIAGETNNRQEAYNRINHSLDAISNLVTAKLNAYQNIMQQAQQGGKRTRRHKRGKKMFSGMYGGYTYDSTGYQGAEVVVMPSRRSRRSRRSNGSRRSRHH